MFRRFRLFPLLMGLIAFVVLSMACNIEDETSPGAANDNNQDPEICDDGDTEPGCDCDDGSTGYQQCEDNYFGDCQCEPSTEENICGGTSELTYGDEPVPSLGGSCGPCDDGEVACDGTEQVECTGASDAASCMATGSVELTAHHEDWEYWMADRGVSVFLLENFSRDCHEAIGELDEPSLLRPVDSDQTFENPIELTLNGVPVGIEYTVVVVLHADHGGIEVASSVGCADVDSVDEDQPVAVDDIIMSELPSELAEGYRFRLNPETDSGVIIDRWVELATELNFATLALGENLLGCFMGGACSGSNSGLIPYVVLRWDNIEPFTDDWGLSNLWWHIENIDEHAETLAGDWTIFWIILAMALDDRWATMIDSQQNTESAYIGDQMMSSFETMTTELMGVPELQSNWERDHSPWEFALRRNVAFDVEEVMWTWGMSLGCFSSSGTPSFGADDCITESVSADDVSWADVDADVTLQSFGWKYFGLKELSFTYPIHSLIDHVWELHLNKFASELSLASGAFFSTLFNCSLLESNVRNHFEEERNHENLSFTDGELDSLMYAFEPFCEEMSNHGDDFFAAAWKAEIVNMEGSYVGQDMELELYEEDIADRLSLGLFPDPYPTSLLSWSWPAFDHLDNDGNDCRDWVFDSSTSDFGFCAFPEIEAVGGW